MSAQPTTSRWYSLDDLEQVATLIVTREKFDNTGVKILDALAPRVDALVRAGRAEVLEELERALVGWPSLGGEHSGIAAALRMVQGHISALKKAER